MTTDSTEGDHQYTAIIPIQPEIGGIGTLPNSILDELERLHSEFLGRNDFTWPENASGERIVTYAFPQVSDIEANDYWDAFTAFNDDQGGDDNTFSGFDPILRQPAAELAMKVWAETIPVQFVPAASVEDADLLFYNLTYQNPATTPGGDPIDGYAFAKGFDGQGVIVFNPDVAGAFTFVPGFPAFGAMLHELGHANGLPHPGTYDASGGEVITFTGDAPYLEDNRGYTVMSYFGERFGQFDFNGMSAMTPRTHDLYVLQDRYGANWETRDGDTRYGFNAIGVPALYDFDQIDNPVLLLWDGGGEDWLDLSGSTDPVKLDLEPGAFSDTHGMIGNIALPLLPENRDGADASNEAYIENAVGGSGDDTLLGNSLGNDLAGGDGNDLIDGRDGADIMRGGDGFDTLVGGDGFDTMDGGLGQDLLDLSDTNDAWNVRLASILDEPEDPSGPGIGAIGEVRLAGVVVDRVERIENILGGEGNEVFEGGLADNKPMGGGGHDLASGLSGEDTLIGGAGNDTLSGGDDDDTIEGGSGADSLVGGQGDDEVVGDQGNDILFGQTGDDTLDGGEGNDTLHSGANDDLVLGGDDNDLITGSAGNDVMRGGLGTDTLSYLTTFAPVSVDFDIKARFQNTGGSDSDQIVGFEILVGTLFGDTLKAESGGTRIEGLAGNDLIVGRAGPDVLLGGVGNDTIEDSGGNDVIDGGGDIDTVSYKDAPGDVQIDLDIQVISRGAGGVDTLISIENADGGAFNDFLAGTVSANTLRGGDGLDLLFGRGGNDLLVGGAGPDLLEGGPGNDTLQGGDGRDTASWLTATAGVTVDLAIAGLQQVAPGEFDMLSEIENLAGSLFGDTLFGDSDANVIRAGAGSDMVDARAGDDTVGGAADGVADVFNGGDGADMIDYSAIVSGLLVDLSDPTTVVNSAETGGDQWTGFENATTGLGDDTLIGSSGANWLDPGAGADHVDAGNGDDTIQASADGAADFLDGGNGIDLLTFEGFDAGVTVVMAPNGGTVTGTGIGDDTIKGFENIQGGNGAEMLSGAGGANLLLGGDGDDTLAGGAGNDTLMGEAGDDVLDGGVGNDVIEDFEGANTMLGGAGGDTVTGGDGDDFLILGAGNDIGNGGGGSDTIEGGSGADILTGGGEADLFVFEARMNSATITDFELGIDLLGFKEYDGVAGLDDLRLSDFGGDALIRAPNGGRILLENIDSASLSETDFVFAV